MKKTGRYFLFLGLILVLSIPFYVWGNLPVTVMPLGVLGLHVNFLMIFVPFFLALVLAWRTKGFAGIAHLFSKIVDFRAIRLWPLLFSLLCLPLITGLAFLFAKLTGQVSGTQSFSYQNIPIMAVLYFLGAIPEEAAWSYTLTSPLVQRYGPILAGAIIGSVWGIWHILPWGWIHPLGWVLGMTLLTILMRIGMVHNYVNGGESLFLALLFHMQINVCTSFFGPAFDPWLACLGMAFLDIALIALGRRKKGEVDVKFG